jgi:hypothetical protein
MPAGRSNPAALRIRAGLAPRIGLAPKRLLAPYVASIHSGEGRSNPFSARYSKPGLSPKTGLAPKFGLAPKGHTIVPD